MKFNVILHNVINIKHSYFINLLGITVYVKLYKVIPTEQGDPVTDRRYNGPDLRERQLFLMT